MLKLPPNLQMDIRQTALVVGIGNHHYLSLTIIKFEFVYSHPGSDTRYALLHNVNLMGALGSVFYTQPAVELSVICEPMSIYCILVDNSPEWEKVH